MWLAQEGVGTGGSVFVLMHPNAHSFPPHPQLSRAAPPRLLLEGLLRPPPHASPPHLPSPCSSGLPRGLPLLLAHFSPLTCPLYSEELTCITLEARGTSRIPHSSQGGLLSAAGILITWDSRSSLTLRLLSKLAGLGACDLGPNTELSFAPVSPHMPDAGSPFLGGTVPFPSKYGANCRRRGSLPKGRPAPSRKRTHVSHTVCDGGEEGPSAKSTHCPG